MSFSCTVQIGHALSAVLCPLCGFSIPLGLRSTGLLVLLSDASVRLLCFSVVALLSVYGWARCFYLVVWLLLAPVWRPGPVFTLVPLSGYLVAAVTA